jgi:hypothetical protein
MGKPSNVHRYNRAVVHMLKKQWVDAEADLSHFLEAVADDTSLAVEQDRSDVRNKRGWCKFRQQNPDGKEAALLDFVDGC